MITSIIVRHKNLSIFNFFIANTSGEHTTCDIGSFLPFDIQTISEYKRISVRSQGNVNEFIFQNGRKKNLPIFLTLFFLFFFFFLY